MTSGFKYIDKAFESLGRAVILLNEDFQVVRVGKSFEKFLCEGAGEIALNKNISEMFFEYNPRIPVDLREIRRKGHVLEAHRSVLMCPLVGAIPVSLTAAPICEDDEPCHAPDSPRYIISIQPGEGHLDQGSDRQTEDILALESKSMKTIVNLIKQLGKTNSNVLITGESGTGKDVVAKAIHSARFEHRSFISINCAAFPGELLENELFGHAKGAYTGAQKAQPGRLELARDGVLFLNEISDMPFNIQIKLLRALESRTFSRLGESTKRTLKARIIAATDMNIGQAVSRGLFHEALYLLLNETSINIPPLRERKADIRIIAKFLLQKIGARIGRPLVLSEESIEKLDLHNWPGNVRELENVLEYAVTFCQGQFIHPEHLPTELTNTSSTQSRERRLKRVLSAHHGLSNLAQDEQVLSEKEQILIALEQNHWNKLKTAQALGIGRTTLYRKLIEYKIQ